MATGQLNGVLQQLRRTMLRDAAERTDGQLLTDYRNRRDEVALAAIVLRHGPMVWGVCRRVLDNYHDAEDAFQATFLVLVRRAASIAAPELVANWLYGVAHQTAMKARATAHRRKAREKHVADMPEPATMDRNLWSDLQPLLDQELSRLPEIARGVLVLCDLQGKSRKEAARQLGLAEGTVASRLARARAMLARRLSQRGITLSGGVLAAVLVQNVASAGVPDSVMVSAIRAASLFAAAETAAAAGIPPKVAALAEGVLKAMMIKKLKSVVAVVLLLGLLGSGTIILTRRTATAQSATPAPPSTAVQDTKLLLEGSKAGDRKELAPGIAFRWCPPGKFKMGEGDDTVDVELSKGFWLGETEVTQGQWQQLMGTTPWSGRTGVGARASTDTTPPKEGSDYPASYISYDDALSFCKKLTTQEQAAGRLPNGWRFLLPTEAQWEYACRAGAHTRFSFGDDESQLGQYAWFFTADRVAEGFAHQVGLKKPNAWGLRDMHGNVWEWCHDWYASRPSGGKDPVGPTTPPAPALPRNADGSITPPPPDGASGRTRVVRGGSYLDVALTCRSANRFHYNPRLGSCVDGFRLAAAPAGQDARELGGEEKPSGGIAPPEPPAGRVGAIPKDRDPDAKVEPPAWGKPLNGLKLGLHNSDAKGDGKRHVTVVLENVGSEDLVLILGDSTARGKKHWLMALRFHLTDNEGRKRVLLPPLPTRDDLADGPIKAPLVMQLVGGGRYSISCDLSECVDPKDADTVIAPGKYRATAEFVGQRYLKSKTDTGPRTYWDILAYWTGTIQSAEIQVTLSAKLAN
jgi:RNA polymerase sigma factor (sigma-70 family)